MSHHSSPDRDELIHWLALLRTPGIGPIRFNALLEHFGDIKKIFHLPQDQLLSSCRLPSKTAAALKRPNYDAAKRDLEWSEKSSFRHIITIRDQNYPPLLKEIADPPPILFVEGQIEALHSVQIAMVGSRNPSQGGIQNAHRFAQTLCNSSLSVTSGLAIGIDTAAHEGALTTQGKTIAVLGSGLDNVYPKRNQKLAAHIYEEGALVSEFPPGTQALAENFPRRNRIISGLSLGTLVVEAAPKSGSLITARLAAEQGREVFAIPGSIHNPNSRGCHALIRQGAKLVECVDEILEELPPRGFSHPTLPVAQPKQSVDQLGLDDKSLKILTNIGHEPIGVDALITYSRLTSDEVSSILLSLELRGLITTAPGGFYTRQVN